VTDYAARLADPTDPLLPVLRAARAWGRPFSVFVGGPVVTTYAHDAGGRLVRSETVEWTADDTQMAVALETYEASLCPGCGESAAETTDIRHDANYDGEDAAPYEELSRVICHRCLARSTAAQAHEGSDYEGAALYTIGVKPVA
jgi:hypothetical protein